LLKVTVKHCAVSGRDRTPVHSYEAPAESFGIRSLAPQFDAATAISLIGRTLDGGVAVDVERLRSRNVQRRANRLLDGSKPPVVVFEFCDWGERAKEPVGEPQRVLATYGHVLWRIQDLLAGARVERPLTKGFETLVGACL
jgi:hypothetical protein